MTMQAMKSTKVRAAVYLLLAVLALVMTTQVLARGSSSTPTHEQELTGVVATITPTSITIGTMTFDIAQAELNDTILVGDVVTVHYSVPTDGTLVAREVQLFAITPEATDAMEANETPEATEAFDDHGQDNPATHVEDRQGAEVGDDNGQDNPANPVEDQHTPQPGDNRGSGNGNGQNDNSGQQDDGGHHGGQSGHGG